jgi:hypothetical protein
MTTALVAASISALVALLTTILAAPLRFWVERNLQSHRLGAEYEYEQRRDLRSLIGRYHGRLVEAAEQLHYRCSNIYAHDPERWLEAPEGFYFQTTCYRVVHLVALSRAFEREAFYIDGRIAEPRDLEFLKFNKAFFWALGDTSLFEGLTYDESSSTDHFFFDELRLMGEAFYPRDGEPLPLSEFNESLAEQGNPFEEMQSFILGLRRGENRLRWDRLVVLDLLVMAFLNAVGYQTHRSTEREIAEVSAKIEHAEVRRNFVSWLPKLGLGEHLKLG